MARQPTNQPDGADTIEAGSEGEVDENVPSGPQPLGTATDEQPGAGAGQEWLAPRYGPDGAVLGLDGQPLPPPDSEPVEDAAGVIASSG